MAEVQTRVLGNSGGAVAQVTTISHALLNLAFKEKWQEDRHC